MDFVQVHQGKTWTREKRERSTTPTRKHPSEKVIVQRGRKGRGGFINRNFLETTGKKAERGPEEKY